MINVNQICLLALTTGSSLSSFAQTKSQSVIASAGDISKGASIILEWTVGEPAIETLSTASALYTQGFHQPQLQVQKVHSNEAPVLKNKIVVYPNPTTGAINVQLSEATGEELVISLLDGGGKVVLNNRLPINSTFLRLNISRLSQGVYTLRITDAKGTAKSDYKIIKTQ